MNDFPTLDELFDYGEEYKTPDLIKSDYFIVDNKRKQQNNQDKDNSKKEGLNDTSDNNSTDESDDDSKEESTNDTSKESNEQKDSGNLSDESSTDELEDDSKESNEKEDSDNISDESSNEDIKDSSEDENDFDDLLNNYDESRKRESERKENSSQQNASDKINDITPSMVYKILKKLVSLSYETYQKGTYKYNKKEIIKHYLTEQKYKILDDLISPIFKPDVYVFDLSPSNDNSLEMYVNAISSVAIKGSLIYLTYNNKILRRLLIKKQNSKSIDVKEVVNSENEKYRNFECTVYNEYQSLYEELKDTKNRKIYIFSDLDISSDMVELSKKNKNIVWFSTENNNAFYSFFEREVPDDYEGLYVDTKDITDIEKYIKEKNKSRYRRRHI